MRRESEDVNNSLIQSDQDLLKQDIKGQMKMLRKGFNNQARFNTGLQHVMSAREIIPPQQKLSTRPDAETGATFFMPNNAIEESKAA